MVNWNELVMARSPLQLGRYNYIREIFVDRIVHKYLYLLDWVSKKKFTLRMAKVNVLEDSSWLIILSCAFINKYLPYVYLHLI